MTEAELKAWMDAYTVAFNAQDSAAASMLFSECVMYQWGPFGELLVGPVAIRRAWDEHQDPAEVAEMTYEVLAVAPDVGVARWIASHTNEREGRRFRYDGVFVITLTDEGLCHSFREWWDSREETL